MLGMRVAQVNESAHLNSVGNLIPPTDLTPDRLTAHIRPPARDGRRRVRSGGLDGEVD